MSISTLRTTAIRVIKKTLDYIESAQTLGEKLQEAEEMMPAKSVSILINEARGGSKGIKAWEHEMVSLINETERVQRGHELDNQLLIQRYDNFFNRVGKEIREREQRYHQCYSDKDGRCKTCGKVLDI